MIGPEHIWFVENRGMDGDYWGANNVRTGGAGATGFRTLRTAELEEQVGRMAERLAGGRAELLRRRDLTSPHTLRGHGNVMNECADRLAVSRRRESELEVGRQVGLQVQRRIIDDYVNEPAWVEAAAAVKPSDTVFVKFTAPASPPNLDIQ